MGTRQLEEQQTPLSDAIDAAEKDGHLVIARKGVDKAVLMPSGLWQRAQPCSNEELLRALQSGPDIELPIPPRGVQRHRKPAAF